MASPAATANAGTPQQLPAAVVKVAPAKIEATVQPGRELTGVIYVYNVGKRALSARAEVENIRMTESTGALQFHDDEGPYGIAALVRVDTHPFKLAPGRAQRVPFRAAIPRGAAPGGYFGSILFRILPSPEREGTAVRQTGRVGTILVLTVAGAADVRGEIRKFEVAGPKVGVSRHFRATYANTGNTNKRPRGVAYRPEGTLTIKNAIGETIAKRKITGELTFPGAERELEIELRRRVWAGRYSARLTLAPGNNAEPRRETLHFWAVSRLAIAIALTAVVAVALVIVCWRRRSRR